MPYKYDFKQIAADVDIYAVARSLDIKIVKGRAYCPACDSDRALEFKEETNTFVCYKGEPREPDHKYLSGDCLMLYGHIKGVGNYHAARALSEQFLSGKVQTVNPDREVTVPATPPQKPEVRTEKSQPAPAFDPDEYAKKLVYNEHVAALGISEADAARLCIGYASKGFHKDRIVFPVRNEDGTIAGFVGVQGSDLKLPQRWIQPKVVRLKTA